MSNQACFSDLIDFYRCYKDIADIKFEGNYLIAKDLSVQQQHWEKIKNNDFEKLIINTTNHSNDSAAPDIENGDIVEFSLLLKANPKKHFDDINRLVASFTPIQKGVMPDYFYLIDVDYLYPNDKEIDEIKRLKKICGFIKFLEKVLPHTEGLLDNHPCLKFVVFSKDFYNKKKSNKVTFSSKFDYNLLPDNLESTAFLEELGSEDDLHTYERITVFQNALVELLSLAPEDGEFNYVLDNLKKLERIYKSNYAIYINDFHLEEFKKDVIESYTVFSNEIDNKINDLVTKMFAVPAVSTAMLFLRTTNTNNSSAQQDYSILIYAIIIVTLLISGMHLKWVMNSLCMIENNIKDVFGRFEGQEQSTSDFVGNKKDELLQRLIDAAFNGYAFASLVLLLSLIVMFYI